MRTSSAFFAALFLWLVHPEAIVRPWHALVGERRPAAGDLAGGREGDLRSRLRRLSERRSELEEAARSAERALRSLDRRIDDLAARRARARAGVARELEEALVALRAERDALLREREELALLAGRLDAEEASLRAQLDLERVRRDRKAVERFLRHDRFRLSPTERLLAENRVP